MVYRIYVAKKSEFANEAKALLGEIKNLLKKTLKLCKHGLFFTDLHPYNLGTLNNKPIIIDYDLYDEIEIKDIGAPLTIGFNNRYLLDALKRGQVSEFSRRDAMRLCRRFKTAESLQPVLNRLCEYGYIAPKPTEPVLGVGRRPSEVYLTNPCLLAS